VEQIRAVPVLHEEARRIAPVLARLTKPCGDQAVIEALKPLVLVYGMGDQAKAPAFWQVYTKQLSDLPLEALRHAVDDYAGRGDSVFFPKPGPLRDMALRRAEPVYKAASRARKAASLPVLGERPPATDEDRERVRRMAAECAAALTRDRPAKPAFPATPVKTDEHGVTPLMRQAMERRAG